MVNGRELIMDLEEIDNIELIRDLENGIKIADIVIQKLNLSVVDSCQYQFLNKNNENDGYTVLYLLKESHFTIHTYIKEQCVSINLYTCNQSTDFEEAIRQIMFFYKNCYTSKTTLIR